MEILCSINQLLAENVTLLIFIISLVAAIKLFTVLVDRYNKVLIPRYSMAFQTFCFNNQVGVFAFCVLVNFAILVHLLENISEAVIGLMSMFYLFRVCLYFKENNIDVVKILFFCYNYSYILDGFKIILLLQSLKTNRVRNIQDQK